MYDEHEDHKSFIPGVGILVTSWDGAESNFVSFDDMNWHNEEQHMVITVYNEDGETVNHWQRLRHETEEEANVIAAGISLPTKVEWVNIKSQPAA